MKENDMYFIRKGFQKLLQSDLFEIFYVIFIIWFMTTMIEWLMYCKLHCNSYGECSTFVERIVSQWDWICDVAKNLW